MSQACESNMADRILAAASDGIIAIDADGRIMFANPTAARLIGYELPEELVGQPLRTHLQFLVGEELCFREDGTSFPIQCEIADLPEDGSDVSGTVVTFRDISQRRSADRARDELIGVVSHELRTPLTSIRSALGLLAGGKIAPLPHTGQRMIDIAVTNTDRLIRLVNDLLDLERINSGQTGLLPVPCEATLLMHEAVDGVQPLADRAGVMLEVAPVAGLVMGDPDRMQQVLTNLLANAIKFSPAAGGTVWLEADESASEIIFRVRDEGRGIPADKLEHVFERFAQVEARDATDKGGSGLGLAISRAIVEQHGGQIWAESTLGVGTTVCVALPRLHGEPTWLPTEEEEGVAAA